MRTNLWLRYFSFNARAVRDIPWEIGADLPAEEVHIVVPSLREFQIGESSDGSQLLCAADRWAARAGDESLPEAIALFVAEEQRHAAELERFLLINGQGIERRNTADTAFRVLRHLTGGLEGSLVVLMTAEIIGYAYYSALRAGTGSSLLRSLCDVFLRDEALHLLFHIDTLARARRGRTRAELWPGWVVSRILMGGAASWAWLRHREVFTRGGLTFTGFASVCFGRLRLSESPPPAPRHARLTSL